MAENEENSGQRDRSPSYPLIPLEAALERLTAFESHFKRSPARPDKIQDAWGIKAKARVNRITAALRYFGLLDYQGIGKDRQIVISEEGRKYLRAEQDEIKREVVKAAALRPKEIAKFWNKWGKDRPADAACLDDLVLEHGFTEAGARKFLGVYDATISFASLSDSDKIEIDDEDEEEGLSPPSDQHRLKKREKKPGMKEDIFTLDEGDVVIQWPERISPESFQDLEDWTKLLLRKIKRHVFLNQEFVAGFDTKYTDDEEGRAAEERSKRAHEPIDDED